jgi:hypothetical protein
MDSDSYAACTSPFTSSALLDGAHTFYVYAIDNASNADATPASYSWTVDTTAPTVSSSVRANADPTAAASVNFTVTFSESVMGVDISDFTLTTTGVSGAAVSGVSGMGDTYTVTVDTGAANGTIRLDVVDDDTIVDLAYNPLGSGFTTGEFYTVDKGAPAPPSVPTLASPANNFLTTDYTPTLDWNNSTVSAGVIFDHYQIQVATDSGFTAIALDEDISGITNSTFTPLSDLAANTTFYWRVRAFNTYGNASAWSATRNFRTALLPPTLISPNDAEQLLNNRPTFDWSDVPGVTGYRIQIANNIGFSPTVTNTIITPSTYTPAADLPVGAPPTLYWRVQSNGANGPSLWSEVRSFTTSNPPSVPSLASPANNFLTYDYTPLLDWNNSTVPAGTTFLKYELQLATDSVFTSPTSADVTGPVTNSSFTPSIDLDSNTTFYWRVRAFNTLGQYSAWSAVRNFRTALLPPTLISPNDAEQLINNRPTFDWADVPGATDYRIQISNNSVFSSTVTNTVVTPSTYTPTSDLPVVGVTLWWRVQSNGANGPSAWSVVRTLTTANPPSVPTLASPANNAQVSGPSPLFNWNNSTVPGGVVFDHYQIQVATDSGFTALVHDNNVAGIANSQDNTAVLASGTTYYWRVRSVSAAGHASAWSAVRSVKINFAGPTLNLPADGSTVSSLTPTFTWNAVSGAATYRIQVSTSCCSFSPGPQLVINQQGITATSYTPSTSLLPGTTYYWHVRVNTPTTTYAPGDWSVVFTFTTP